MGPYRLGQSSYVGHQNHQDDLVTVPTLNEAFDTIEIEEIERDLGYL